jgi:cytoskeletal protein RodZ
MRGVTLDEITTATRIGPRFLQALENERWEELPGGVFNRGFVKAIAHYLGIDEEALLGEYTLATGDAGTPSSTVARTPTRSLPLNEPRVPWLTWLLAAVLFAAIAGGAIYLWRRHVAKRNAAPPAAVVAIVMAAPGGGTH